MGRTESETDAKLEVELRLGGLIRIGAHDIALGTTFALLDGIAREGSVSRAAERLRVSYRSAWGKIASIEDAMGRPLVIKTKGHGSTLTPAGAALLDTLALAFRRCEGPRLEAEAALKAGLAAIVGAPLRRLRIAASPDPVLLGALADWSEIELTTMGSLAAIDRLLSGAADAAGVHFGLLDPSAEPAFAALAADASLVLRPLLVREQGLMLAPGNPLAIRSIGDLAASKARFVNRQRGSGTRLWFDRLLAEAEVSASAIAGYDVEEFTHQAVAAVIAAGAADAGMGARAMAERFGLAFAPIGQETYFLCHRGKAETPVIEQIVRRVRERVREEVGYRLPASERRAPGR